MYIFIDIFVDLKVFVAQKQFRVTQSSKKCSFGTVSPFLQPHDGQLT